MNLQDPLSALPTRIGDQFAVSVNKTEKQILNRALSRAGFQAEFGPDSIYTDWIRDGDIYRVYHNYGAGHIVRLAPSEQVDQESIRISLPETPSQSIEISKGSTSSSSGQGNIGKPRVPLTPQRPRDLQMDALRVGMYVRIPLDEGAMEGDFREYAIGQVQSLNELADTVTVELEVHAVGEDPTRELRTCPRAFVRRCRVLPDTPFRLHSTQQQGTLLTACEDSFRDGEFIDYFVRIRDKTSRLPESELIVGSHRADPDPLVQASTYEFHHPSFKSPRDRLLQTHVELKSATLGLEDLVGSRVELLAHQAEVVSRVLGDKQCRYVLADEVGLGKTIEACVIIKALRRRYEQMKTLLIVPSSLLAQWHFELDSKFWLDFATLDDPPDLIDDPICPGLLVSVEEIERNPRLATWLAWCSWGLIVIDEAHHVTRRPDLFKYLSELSTMFERCLVLTATPIQRRSTEFLKLLQLMNPKHYLPITEEAFSRILAAQSDLMRRILALLPDMTPEYFDARSFCEAVRLILDQLTRDEVLASLINSVERQQEAPDLGLSTAKEVIGYIAENYRVERRVIRNRRVNLQLPLPRRVLNTDYSYSPDSIERRLIDSLHTYADEICSQLPDTWLSREYARLLMSTAFSSPEALRSLLVMRQERLTFEPDRFKNLEMDQLWMQGSPRGEPRRIEKLLGVLATLKDEEELLEELIWQTENWQMETERVLATARYGANIPPSSHRLMQVLRAVQDHLRQHPEGKIVVFATWIPTLQELQKHLVRLLGTEALAEFHSLMSSMDLQKAVDRFQSESRCHVLLCDELGGEGRNFQIADIIIHVDLPWTPARVEQRIGRVDRLGRRGEVVSIVPFSEEQLEHDLFLIWQEAFELFTRSLSGLEIALEEVQEKLLGALGRSSRNGIFELKTTMIEDAKELRRQVEEERYYEEESIDHRRRAEIERVSERYRDGQLLREPLLRWARQVGLQYTYHPSADEVRYYPTQFNYKMMRNAKLVSLPNMEEALRRSRHPNNHWVSGTFNRATAVVREDLIFFAPGSDPWTGAILENVVEADRGRCSAIYRISEAVDEPWRGFELFFRVQPNPRPLYELGASPIHLLRAQGYLHSPTYRLLISDTHQVLPSSHYLYEVTHHPFARSTDKHLGKRTGSDAYLPHFRKHQPPNNWREQVESIVAMAKDYLQDEYDFMIDLAEEARELFVQQANGMRAAITWQQTAGNRSDTASFAEVEGYEEISAALVKGIGSPEFRLESICYWIIVPHKPNA